MINLKTVQNAIQANNNNPSVVIKRFGLTRKVTKEFSNDLCKAGYFLGNDLCFELTEAK